MSDIEKKRDYVYHMYGSPGWRQKVLKMPDSQVIAIYLGDLKRKERAAKKEREAKRSQQQPLQESDDDAPF
jgi:hypothetical protein